MRIETSLTRMVGERQLRLMRLSSTNIANKITRYPLSYRLALRRPQSNSAMLALRSNWIDSMRRSNRNYSR